MSEVIYLKDILLKKTAKATKKTTSTTASGRPKLKPFKYGKALKSSLIEKNKQKEDRNGG
jgi:hypothetical protein